MFISLIYGEFDFCCWVSLFRFLTFCVDISALSTFGNLCSLRRSSTLNSVADALMLGLAMYAYVVLMISAFGS